MIVIGELHGSMVVAISRVDLGIITGLGPEEGYFPNRAYPLADGRSGFVPARVATDIRESGYLHLIEKLRGLETRARDNTFSAHALLTDVMQIVKNEIEYPTI